MTEQLANESSGYLWLDKILPTLDVDYEHYATCEREVITPALIEAGYAVLGHSTDSASIPGKCSHADRSAWSEALHYGAYNACAASRSGSFERMSYVRRNTVPAEELKPPTGSIPIPLSSASNARARRSRSTPPAL